MLGVRNLLCDLGGVLYVIEYQRTFSALAGLSREPETLIYSHTVQSVIFDEYEKGLVTTSEFRQRLREHFRIEGTDQEIDQAWNALLLHLLPKVNQQVQSLRTKYQMALLSNINELHHQAIAEECKTLFSHFHQCFFSYQEGLRKPQPEIFNLACNKMHFIPTETLFIDDSPVNVAAAKDFGLQTYLVDQEHPFETIAAQLMH